MSLEQTAYRIADVFVNVSAEAPVIHSLNRSYRRMPHLPSSARDGMVHLTVRQIDDEWTIQSDGWTGEKFASADVPLGAFVLELTNTIAAEAAKKSSFLFLHAAALERDGDAIVIGGPSLAGKSTLAAHLLSRGWRLLSDEYAIVEPVSGKLVPYHKLMVLRSGSIPLVPRSFRKACEASPWFVGSGADTLHFAAVEPALPYGDRVWSEGGRLRKLFLLAEPRPHAHAELLDLPSAIHDVMSLTWDHVDPLQSLERILHALREVSVARLYPGQPIETADLIEAAPAAA